MLEAYFDESGIHDGAAMCVIAGYFGYAAQWRAFEKKWLKVLGDHNTRLADFHATDLIDSYRHQPMLEELAEGIATSAIYPVSAGIVVADFLSLSEKQRKFMTGATISEKTHKLITSGAPNRPYFVPFQLCLRKTTDYTEPGRKVNFFFGLDKPMSKYARIMFKQIKTQGAYTQSVWHSKRRLGDPAFPFAKETPQLQAADLYAHLTYRHMLERHQANDWDVPPTGLLLTCLRNVKSVNDHVFLNKLCLQLTLAQTYVLAGKWDDHKDDQAYAKTGTE